MDKARMMQLKELFVPASIEVIREYRDLLQRENDRETSCVNDAGIPNPESLFDKRVFGLATHRNTIGIPDDIK